mmetsp:Transcript_17736/g.51089  ORF Transcript_17736/g.51089 Transcript_17736/m.51089 type:complete len:200 (-) Transcript_17736:497-1096(-)
MTRGPGASGGTTHGGDGGSGASFRLQPSHPQGRASPCGRRGGTRLLGRKTTGTSHWPLGGGNDCGDQKLIVASGRLLPDRLAWGARLRGLQRKPSAAPIFAQMRLILILLPLLAHQVQVVRAKGLHRRQREAIIVFAVVGAVRRHPPFRLVGQVRPNIRDAVTFVLDNICPSWLPLSAILLCDPTGHGAEGDLGRRHLR